MGNFTPTTRLDSTQEFESSRVASES